MSQLKQEEEEHRAWDDGLRARIEPQLSVVPRNHQHSGRKRPGHRRMLHGILIVLSTGIR